MIWLLLVVPLTSIGTVIGGSKKQWKGFPCRVNPIPRQIPRRSFYTNSFFIALIAGLFPFGAIFIELHFLLTSFWTYKVYHLYGFLLIMFILLLIVIGCISVLSTYILLNYEDHRWHWTSLWASGSVSIYIFLYSIHYFFFVSK